MGFTTDITVKVRFPASLEVVNMKLTKEEKDEFIKDLPVIETGGLCGWTMTLNALSCGDVGFTNSTEKSCGMSWRSTKYPLDEFNMACSDSEEEDTDMIDKYAEHVVSVSWYGYLESLSRQQNAEISEKLTKFTVQKIKNMCPYISIIYDDLSQLEDHHNVVVVHSNSVSGVIQ